MNWIGPTISGAVTSLFGWLAIQSNGWATFWFGVLFIGGVAETVALARQERGDTLSETVWRTTKHPAAKIALAASLLWVFIHFIFEI